MTMFRLLLLLLLLLNSSLLFATASTETIRFLEEDEEDFEYNSLADFQLRFEKCQFVKSFDADQESMLALKHFAVFRLCDDCDECEVYGTYALQVEQYLQYTMESQREDFEYMCENCDQKCNEDGEYCSGCGMLCYQYENLEDNGYLDAAEYTECQLWEPENDDDGEQQQGDDDGQAAYYIGPRCNSGNSITIGVFSDENCWEPVDDVDVEDLLGAKLSYHLLRHTYSSEDQVCLSCLEDADNDDADNDGDDVNEMCENVYAWAAKCESKTGLESGFIQVNREEDDYENQVENEFMACTFINSLIWDSYTETGEINWEAKQDVIIRKVTKKQLISLGLLSVLFLSLLGGVHYFNQKIEKVSSSSPLLTSGGTLT